jgi:hypothetical protein
MCFFKFLEKIVSNPAKMRKQFFGESFSTTEFLQTRKVSERIKIDVLRMIDSDIYIYVYIYLFALHVMFTVR